MNIRTDSFAWYYTYPFLYVEKGSVLILFFSFIFFKVVRVCNYTHFKMSHHNSKPHCVTKISAINFPLFWRKKRKLDFKTLHANLHSYIITHTHVNAFFTMYDYHLFSAERIVMMMALVFMRVFSCIYIIPLWE